MAKCKSNLGFSLKDLAPHVLFFFDLKSTEMYMFSMNHRHSMIEHFKNAIWTCCPTIMALSRISLVFKLHFCKPWAIFIAFTSPKLFKEIIFITHLLLHFALSSVNVLIKDMSYHSQPIYHIGSSSLDETKHFLTFYQVFLCIEHLRHIPFKSQRIHVTGFFQYSFEYYFLGFILYVVGSAAFGGPLCGLRIFQSPFALLKVNTHFHGRPAWTVQ